MVSKIEKKGCKNIDEALLVIDNEMAKEIRIKSLTGNGQQIAFSADRDLFINPRASKFYANAIVDDELAYDGSPMDGDRDEAVNAVGTCENCGNTHVNGVCKAQGVTCYHCFRTGHFSRVCKSRKKQVATLATPAQKRFSQKSARRRENEKKVINNVEEEESQSESEDSERESEKEVGQIGSESDTEIVNALKKIRRKFGNLRFNKQLRKINVVDERINAVSALPFLHAKLIDKNGKKANINILFDSGSSCSLVSKRFLESKNLIFDPISYELVLQGCQVASSVVPPFDFPFSS